MTPDPESRDNTDSTGLDFEKPEPWVLGGHRRNLVRRVKGQPAREAKRKRDGNHIGRHHLHMSLAELQRMRLRVIQCRLVGSIMKLHQGGTPPERWEDDLKEYIQAVRDYEFMGQFGHQANDPFVISAERLTEDQIMQLAWKGAIQDPLERDAAYNDLKEAAARPWESAWNPIGGTRYDTKRQAWYSAFLRRLLISLFGGLFMLAPMWIMVLHNTRATCLATTTVFTVVFGVIVARFVERPGEVLAGTLAYAAVLVVFVGLAVELDGNSDPVAVDGRRS
ncbi:hypothetical protein VTJ83DRAFT_2234 [Remersonia thermophila]|uniref:DUF6594 domain-containing protein n=1 Tax=Remersonia thermophila TaxID=72144 RepID=A0ABR4DI54_9PEZI